MLLRMYVLLLFHLSLNSCSVTAFLCIASSTHQSSFPSFSYSRGFAGPLKFSFRTTTKLLQKLLTVLLSFVSPSLTLPHSYLPLCCQKQLKGLTMLLSSVTLLSLPGMKLGAAGGLAPLQLVLRVLLESSEGLWLYFLKARTGAHGFPLTS